MRTVFIAAPFFPPSAMPPAQRVRLLVRHLEDYDWHPVIFTVNPARLEEGFDPWMLEIAGNRYEKIETKCLDARKTRRFGIGDLGLRSFIFLFFSLLKHARRRKPALIVYPVPPWYTMVMAPFIKWFTGIPYAIDFIDPWIYKVDRRNRKARMNQWIARRLEGFVVKRSSAILAVSKGILDDVAARNPAVNGRPMIAVPYGVEASDFRSITIKKATDSPVILRYTGAISEAMLPVTDTLLQAFRRVHEQLPISVTFTGTSYAAKQLARPVLEEQVKRHGLSGIVTENPQRVGYKEALELSLGADLQLLIGDTTPYYAASKLMGLAASGQPFFAFVHRESFPAKFLKELNYPYTSGFLPDELGTPQKIEELAAAILAAIAGRDRFQRIDADHPILAQYTADAMTKTFSETFKLIVHE